MSVRDNPLRFGRTRVAVMLAAYNDLRAAIRAHDPIAAEAALDRYEPWADMAYAKVPGFEPGQAVLDLPGKAVA
jgi:hypothetical protein